MGAVAPVTFPLAVLIAVVFGGMCWKTGAAIRASWFIMRLWWWLSGEAHHGKPVTNAGLFRRGEGPALTRTGHAHRWWYRPRWQRAAHRTGGTLGFITVIWGLLADLWLTLWLLGAALLAVMVFSSWRVRLRLAQREQERTWLLPLHLAAHELAGIPRAVRASSWIKPELDESGAVRKVTLELPPGWQADPKDEQKLITMASAKLSIEAPEPTWRRAGQTPMLILTHSEPPPDYVKYGEDELGEMLAQAVARAASHELVVGLGKPERGGGRPRIVKASLKLDSPHFAINMGTGGGKSNLAAFWMMQELHRGAIVMVLDSKWHSHPWLFKDADGEFDYLPNVAYLSSIPQIHAGMIWLGRELLRRNQVTTRAVNTSGHMRGSVGPRLWVVAEELNYTTPDLRNYWAEARERDDPKKSPALTALGALSFAGRAVDMHLKIIGQMLTADVTGSRDNSVKENVGVTAMARYGPPGWGTAIGKNVPMPPSPSQMGRIQLVTRGGDIRETQTPEADYPLYRQLAMSGIVTPCPSDMPRMGHVLAAPELPAPAPDQPVVVGQRPYLGPPPMSLRELRDNRVADRTLDALRKAAQRPGFPSRVGVRGQEYLYDPVAVADWDVMTR